MAYAHPTRWGAFSTPVTEPPSESYTVRNICERYRPLGRFLRVDGLEKNFCRPSYGYARSPAPRHQSYAGRPTASRDEGLPATCPAMPGCSTAGGSANGCAVASKRRSNRLPAGIIDSERPLEGRGEGMKTLSALRCTKPSRSRVALTTVNAGSTLAKTLDPAQSDSWPSTSVRSHVAESAPQRL